MCEALALSALIGCAGHAREDTFVTKEHSEKLIARYGSPGKELMLFDGDHNSVRPTKFYGKVLMFFHQALQCQGALIPDEQNSGAYEVAMETEAARYLDNINNNNNNVDNNYTSSSRSSSSNKNKISKNK